MGKKITNERCPFHGECERKCIHQGKELDCDYYNANAMPGAEIYDQELARQMAWELAQEKTTAAAEPIPEAKPEAEADYDDTPVSLGQTSGQTNGVSYLSGPRGVTEKIKQAMYNAAREFVYIGFLLWEVQEYGYYRENGYRDVYEYAEAELNFKRSSTKNFIAICKEFSNSETQHLANGSISIRGNKISSSLQPKYEQFNYSQLCEMLSMAPAQREQVQPDTSVRQIRELKKTAEPDSPPDMETIPLALPDDVGQTSGQEMVSIVLNNIWKEAPRELVKELVKLAGLRCTPSMCFTFTVKKHEG